MSSQIMHRLLCSSCTSGLFRISFRNLRAFSTAVESPEAKPPKSGTQMSTKTHKVDGMERRMLVWTGKYKSTDEVPSYVNQDVMEKARNKIRIRTANIMMAITAVACLIMIWSGKQAAERGETVQKMNLDWHKEYNEQSIAEAQAKKSK